MEGYKENKKRGEKGFSLIEIIIVLLIISIIASVTIPRYFDTKNRAKVAEAYTDLHFLRRALSMYEADRSRYVKGNITDYQVLKDSLKTLYGEVYLTLPDTPAFDFVSYISNGSTYTIVVIAKDLHHTQIVATPEGVTEVH